MTREGGAGGMGEDDSAHESVRRVFALTELDVALRDDRLVTSDDGRDGHLAAKLCALSLNLDLVAELARLVVDLDLRQ